MEHLAQSPLAQESQDAHHDHSTITRILGGLADVMAGYCGLYNLGYDAGATMKKKRKHVGYPEPMDYVMLGLLIAWAVAENWTRLTILTGNVLP